MKSGNRLIKKTFIFFVFIIVLPTIIVVLASNLLFQNVLIENAISSFQTNINNLTSSLENELFDTKLSAYYIYLDIDLKEAIDNYVDNPMLSEKHKRAVEEKFQNYKIAKSFANVDSIKVYGFNGFSYAFGEEDQSGAENKIIMSDSYTEALSNPDDFIWTGIQEENGKKIISLYRVIKDRSYTKEVGMLYVKFDAQMYSSLLNEFRFNEKGSVYILDNNNSPLMNQEIPINLMELLKSKEQRLKKNYSYQLEGENNEKYFLQYISKYNWKIVGVLPVNEVTKPTQQIFLCIMCAFLLFLFIASVIWFFVLSKLFLPINQLTIATKEVREGNFNVQVKCDNKDELGTLTNDFNFMVRKINELLHELLAENNKKRDAEYKALQAQINPHFLYNTLNSIRWMAIIQKADNIKKIVEALSALLRNSTSKIDQYITVKEEINILNDYVYIQKIAYTNKFTVEYEVEKDVLRARCLKFILQPLVENAIYHGIIPKETYGTIWVKINKKNNTIHLSVKDDGVGINKERLKGTIKTEKTFKKLSGIGLNGVSERLEMAYGNKSLFEVESLEGVYTKVSIIIPLEYEEEEGIQ